MSNSSRELRRIFSYFLAGQRSSSSRHFFDACGNVNLAATAAHPNPKRGVPEQGDRSPMGRYESRGSLAHSEWQVFLAISGYIIYIIYRYLHN